MLQCFESLTWHTGAHPLFDIIVDSPPHISELGHFIGCSDARICKIVDRLQDLSTKSVEDKQVWIHCTTVNVSNETAKVSSFT